MTRVGITGHRYFAEGTLQLVEEAVAAVLATVDGSIELITSLAVGADQVLARQVLALGGTVTFVQPCHQLQGRRDRGVHQAPAPADVTQA